MRNVVTVVVCNVSLLQEGLFQGLVTVVNMWQGWYVGEVWIYSDDMKID